MKKVLILILTAVLMGCSGTKALLSTGEEMIDFKKYKTVCLRTTDEVENNYSVGATHLFDEMLKEKLISMGFEIAQEDTDLRINVAITRAYPGNVTLRVIVGFGAGVARIDYKVQFKDRNNNILSEFSGWESNSAIAADYAIRLEMVRVAVNKVAHFIKEGKPLE